MPPHGKFGSGMLGACLMFARVCVVAGDAQRRGGAAARGAAVAAAGGDGGALMSLPGQAAKFASDAPVGGAGTAPSCNACSGAGQCPAVTSGLVRSKHPFPLVPDANPAPLWMHGFWRACGGCANAERPAAAAAATWSRRHCSRRSRKVRWAAGGALDSIAIVDVWFRQTHIWMWIVEGGRHGGWREGGQSHWAAAASCCGGRPPGEGEGP
eukprot:353017-Chlamydomonas_euryale.AAC.6